MLGQAQDLVARMEEIVINHCARIIILYTVGDYSEYPDTCVHCTFLAIRISESEIFNGKASKF